MPTFEEIYARHAAEYEALVAREDYQNNLLRAIQGVIDLNGIDVIELGAGTGRVTRLLAPFVRSIRAFDASAHMLKIGDTVMKATGTTNWTLQVADNKALPVEAASADLLIEGWSFGHATVWHVERWRDEIGAALDEMRRAARPGGALVVIETLGTGALEPAPPSQALADFYAYLENEHGFIRHAVRTDYRFDSLEEAVTLSRFFFGDEMADRVQRENWQILPEWTGVWSLRLP